MVNCFSLCRRVPLLSACCCPVSLCLCLLLFYVICHQPQRYSWSSLAGMRHKVTQCSLVERGLFPCCDALLFSCIKDRCLFLSYLINTDQLEECFKISLIKYIFSIAELVSYALRLLSCVRFSRSLTETWSL